MSMRGVRASRHRCPPGQISGAFWNQEGDASLVFASALAVNRRPSDDRRARIGDLLRDKYGGFDATLTSETLLQVDGIRV